MDILPRRNIILVVANDTDADTDTDTDTDTEEVLHTSNYALIVQSSKYWFNYRHAINALLIYQMCKSNGIPDENIILMMSDELPLNTRNPYKNSMIYTNMEGNRKDITHAILPHNNNQKNEQTNKQHEDSMWEYNQYGHNHYHNNRNKSSSHHPPGDDQYDYDLMNLLSENVEIDYRGDDVTIDNMISALIGRRHRYHSDSGGGSSSSNSDNNKRGSKYFKNLDAKSNILIYWTGHGGEEFFKFQDLEEITSDYWARDVLYEQLYLTNKYHKILFVADTCQAFTLANHIAEMNLPNVYAIGSSLQNENSYAHHSNTQLGLSIVERYTYSFTEYIKAYNAQTKQQRKDHITQQVQNAKKKKNQQQQQLQIKKKYQHFLSSLPSKSPFYFIPPYDKKQLSLTKTMIDPYPYKMQRAHIGYHPNNRTIMDTIYITEFFTNIQTSVQQQNSRKEQHKVELLFSPPISPLSYDDDDHHHPNDVSSHKNDNDDDHENYHCIDNSFNDMKEKKNNDRERGIRLLKYDDDDNDNDENNHHRYQRWTTMMMMMPLSSSLSFLEPIVSATATKTKPTVSSFAESNNSSSNNHNNNNNNDWKLRLILLLFLLFVFVATKTY